MGKLIGPLIELAIGHLLFFKDQGYGAGCALYLDLEELMNTAVLGIESLCGIPLDQQLLSFGPG